MRDLLEILFFLSGIAMPIIAVWALLYAKAQVNIAKTQADGLKEQIFEARRYSEISAQQAQETLLLNLVDKWNTAHMHESKIVTLELEAQAQDRIYTEYKGYPDKQVLEKLREHYKELMGKLEIEDNKKYITMMRMLSFFETVGELVKKRYVLLEDIDGLFRGPILDVGAAWVLHLNDKQNRKGVPAGLYENAIFLIAEIEKLGIH